MTEPLDYERPTPPPRSDFFRVAGGLCGVLGLPGCCYLLGAMDTSVWFLAPALLPIIAIAFGIADRQTIPAKRRPLDRGYRWAITLGLVALLPMILVTVYTPGMGKARPTAQRVKCASNLRQIGIGIILYANDHGNRFPNDLQTVFNTQGFPAHTFICPHDHSDGLDWTQGGPLSYGQNLSYVYLGRTLNNTGPPDNVLAVEPIANHSGDGANVLFTGGYVEFLDPDALRDMLDAEVDAGRLAPELRDVLLKTPD